MKKQEKKITVTCPKCGEEIDIREILENERVRDYFEKMISDDRECIKEMVIKKEWFETEICKIQSKIKKLSKSDSENHKNTISKLQAQKCDMKQLKQKITELIDGLEKQIKSFETEISNKKFTCPKCGAEIDNIKGLLKKAITLLNSQEVLLNERLRLEHKLNYEEVKISRLLQEQAILEQNKTIIEKLSESYSEEEKNMVSELRKLLIDTEQRIKVITAKIRETEEKIISLQNIIKSLEEEMHKDRKEK